MFSKTIFAPPSCHCRIFVAQRAKLTNLFRSKATVAATSAVNQQSSSRDELDYAHAKPFREIPGTKGLPFIGTLLQYRRGPYRIDRYQDVLLERYREYGKIYKETIAGETIVHLLDPDYVKVIYLQEGKVPHIPPLMLTAQMYRKYRGMSPGLGNTNGEEWYRLRSAVQQMMMRPKAVTMYLPLVNEVADDFIQRMMKIRDPSTGEVPNFRNEVLKWNLESSCMTSFETRFGCLEAGPNSHQQRMLDANADIFRLSLKLKFSLPIYKLISTPSWKKLTQAEDYFFGNGQKMVDETAAKIQELTDAKKLQYGQYGFLTYLLGKPELSYKDVSIITLSLFADGLSTTVPTLIGQLYCLATNPEKQQKVYEEICEVVPSEGPITPDMINKLSYLKACIKEGFRFFPIGTEVSRIPQKNLVIGGYQIPAGSHVELHNNMLLRMPEYFEDPESYIPERWVRGGSAQNIHPYLLIPFGHGPRMCAGRRFAEQEMHVLITKILQKFRIEWPYEERMDQEYNLLLRPNLPPRFQFVPRDGAVA